MKLQAFAFVIVVVALLGNKLLQFWAQNPVHIILSQSNEKFVRYDRCIYHWWWYGKLKELGNFIVKARINMESKEEAWKQWAAMNATGSIEPVHSRLFNGTKERFVELWNMNQCPPGPCGPRGYPCPTQFPGFDCRNVEPCCGSYCCDAAGCYHDGCDNDGCFPRYEPCTVSECGQPG